MEQPKEMNWKYAKWIFRYLRGTFGYGLVYRSTEDFRMIGYIDSDWVGCMDDRKIFNIILFEIWFSKM
jgi:hypothetical protein